MEATKTLLSVYASASPESKQRGRTWYDQARRECRRISRETGVSYRRVAAVLAITSPGCQLTHNLGYAERACREGSGHGRYPTDQAPKVHGALNDARPERHVKGPKVTAFYRAILGDSDSLTIDRWAAYAAGWSRSRTLSSKDHREIGDAYREAARVTGESLRDFQAIVWIQTRETTADANGTVRKYADIV